MARKRLRQHFRIASLETCSARHGVQLALTGRQHRSRQIPGRNGENEADQFALAIEDEFRRGSTHC